MAFFKDRGNRSYTKEIKERAVKEYLAGTGSLLDICEKYNIPSDNTLITWIKLYNANIGLKDIDVQLLMQKVMSKNILRFPTLVEK